MSTTQLRTGEQITLVKGDTRMTFTVGTYDDGAGYGYWWANMKDTETTFYETDGWKIELSLPTKQNAIIGSRKDPDYYPYVLTLDGWYCVSNDDTLSPESVANDMEEYDMEVLYWGDDFE